MTDRFLSHNELATKGRTVKYRPWVIAHTEEFQTKKGSYYKGKPIEIGQQQKVCL
nr:hypothetical protein [Mucilaginibacter xinganensis]